MRGGRQDSQARGRQRLPHVAHLAAALTRALIKRGNVPFLIDTGNTPQETEAAHAALFGYRAEATIVLSGSPPASFVELARRNGQPMVMIGRSEPDCDHIRLDNVRAAADIAAMFVRSGLSRLGLAGSSSGTPSIVEREQAFIQTSRQLGADLTVARGPDSDYCGGQVAAQAMLSGRARPQAVFCVNDLIALGFIDAVRRLGLSVPADLSVVGFDDIPEASWDAYRLTTFRQDPEAIAAAAIAQMERRVADPSAAPSIVQLSAVLVRRASAMLKEPVMPTEAASPAGGNRAFAAPPFDATISGTDS